MQNLTLFEKALKENYLPVLNNMLGIEPSALLSKIKQPKVTSNEIVTVAPVGLSGGFAFSEEGYPTPKAGGVRMERMALKTKDMYANIVISQKVVELTKSGGAMANALDVEMEGATKAAKWNVGRALFGNGTGILTTTKALASAGNVIEVTDTTYLKDGLIIDIYATGETSPQTNGAGRRIKSVDLANKKITIDGDASTFSAGFITVQNSYNREITGLGAIYDDSIATLYGLSKEENSFLKPVVEDGGDDISDGLITKALRRAKNEKGSEIDMLLCGDDAYDAYTEYLRTNNVRVEEISHEISGGFKAIKFIFGNKLVEIVNESFVPAKEMWGVETNQLEFHNTGWKFAELQGGGIFNLMENQSTYRALLTNYGELLCKHPGGCVRIANCCA